MLAVDVFTFPNTPFPDKEENQREVVWMLVSIRVCIKLNKVIKIKIQTYRQMIQGQGPSIAVLYRPVNMHSHPNHCKRYLYLLHASRPMYAS